MLGAIFLSYFYLFKVDVPFKIPIKFCKTPIIQKFYID
jgi:hypothetical protein